MRTTTLPSMLDILTRNYNYRNKSARLYELARVYLPGGEDGLANESKVLTLGAYGGDMDFYAMKGAVEAILKDIRAADIHFEGPTGAPSDASWHPGRCATVWSGSDCIGIFGQIHPLAAQNYGVDAELYCAELSFDELLNAKGPDPEYVPLPRFPAVTRDIAVVCGEKVTVGALEDCIRRGAKGLLKEVALFDIYRGKGVDEGKKSVAFNLTLRADDRSLTSEEEMCIRDRCRDHRDPRRPPGARQRGIMRQTARRGAAPPGRLLCVLSNRELKLRKDTLDHGKAVLRQLPPQKGVGGRVKPEGALPPLARGGLRLPADHAQHLALPLGLHTTFGDEALLHIVHQHRNLSLIHI